jgi:hypothetical protein
MNITFGQKRFLTTLLLPRTMHEQFDNSSFWIPFLFYMGLTATKIIIYKFKK